jgi:hypothetical protein
MEIDCDAIVERYLLIKNPIYTFSFPISVLISIIVFGFVKAYKYSDNSYINQILIPLTTLLVCMVVIDMVSRALVDKDDKEKIKKLCSSYMNDPNKFKKILKEKALNMDEVEKYNGKVDGFVNNNNEQVMQENVIDPLKDRSQQSNVHIFDNITTKFIKNPSLMNNNDDTVGDFPKDQIMCVGDTQTYNGNLCSGMNNKPDGLVAPVPGPQWLPQTAGSVQKRLKTNNYTKNRCLGEPQNFGN